MNAAGDARFAVVTGAGRGIGRGIALELARQGFAGVAVVDLLGSNADSVAAELSGAGCRALAIQADLTDQAQAGDAVAKAVGEFGRIHALVNNAGWDRVEPFLESSPETWEKIININFKAQLYVSRALLPHLIERGGGRIINIASDAGRVGSMGEAVYSGMKGAVISFSKSLAREMARHRITVNVVCPGLTETPLMEEIRGTSEWSSRVMESITRSIPLRRLGQPADIAAAVAFFASPAAEYITGQTISVSGGLTMC